MDSEVLKMYSANFVVGGFHKFPGTLKFIA